MAERIELIETLRLTQRAVEASQPLGYTTICITVDDRLELFCLRRSGVAHRLGYLPHIYPFG